MPCHMPCDTQSTFALVKVGQRRGTEPDTVLMLLLSASNAGDDKTVKMVTWTTAINGE